MIILKEQIELNIYHCNNFWKFTVIETHANEDVFFKVFFSKEYYCTLVPSNTGTLSFALSSSDKDIAIDIDEILLSKIKASLYSVFLREDPS